MRIGIALTAATLEVLIPQLVLIALLPAINIYMFSQTMAHRAQPGDGGAAGCGDPAPPPRQVPHDRRHGCAGACIGQVILVS